VYSPWAIAWRSLCGPRFNLICTTATCDRRTDGQTDSFFYIYLVNNEMAYPQRYYSVRHVRIFAIANPSVCLHRDAPYTGG